MFSNIVAIVPAAGQSRRMGSDIKCGSKILLEIAPDCTVLGESLGKLFAAGIRHLIIPTRSELTAEVTEIAHRAGGWDTLRVIVGGSTRFASVLESINAAPELRVSKRSEETPIQRWDYVLVHDAARPFIQPDDITRLCKLVQDGTSRILAVRSTSTLKVCLPNTTTVERTIDRSLIWEVQTPQVFPARVFVHAYLHADPKIEFTDDSSVVEAANYPVLIEEGNHGNIKITTPPDLDFATYLLTARDVPK